MEKTQDLSRRGFLKWSSVLGGTIALSGAFVGCTTGSSSSGASSSASASSPSAPVPVVDSLPITAVVKDGWFPVACWADCGSRGYNKAFVKDGIIMHQGTDETVPDSFWTPQLRGCQKGRMLRKRVLGLDRMKFPVKRKNFTAISRGGKMSGIDPTDSDNYTVIENSVNEHLRGKDEWVRISWDEALDTIADEIIRIQKDFGNRSIYSPRPGSYNGYTDLYRALCLFGGFVQDWGAQSSGTWGSQPFGLSGSYNDTRDLLNADLIVLWANNPSWSGAGLYNFQLTQMKKPPYNKRFISLDPTHTSTAITVGVTQDDWYPVRVMTDIPLVLSIMHELITQDEAEAAKGVAKADRLWLNWDYIDKYCFGFNSDNFAPHPQAKDFKPEDYDPAVNLSDYVMARGKYAAAPYIERTPEWASKICGIRPSKIRELTKLLRAKNDDGTLRNVSFISANGICRQHDLDQWPQIFTALAMITGHTGRPGNCVGASGGHIRTAGPGGIVRGGANCGRPTNFPEYNDKIIEKIGKNEITIDDGKGGKVTRELIVSNSMLNPLWNEIRINRNELWYAFSEKQYHNLRGERVPIDIRMLWLAKGERVNQNPDATSAARAFRSMEFVGAMDQYLTPMCQYSDIVLPATSLWEKIGSLQPAFPEQMIVTRQIIEPIFEAKDDVWVARQIAERLQKVNPFVDPDIVQPCTPAQDIFNMLSAATIKKEDGSTGKLLTIEEDDAARYGAEFTDYVQPQTGVITLKEFEKQGIYHVQRSEGDSYGLGLADGAFIKGNGETNPLNTTSGKFEIHCKTFVDTMNRYNYSRNSNNANYKENYSPAYTPIPEYRVVTEGYEWTFKDRDINGPKGPLPLQYMTLHVQRRAHSSYENTPGLWDIFMHPLYMNPEDAEARGLKEGDAVKIQGEAGASLRNLHISEFIRPGHCAMGQGAWVDLDTANGIDRAGSTNALFATRRITGQGQMHLQSTPVEVSKWTDYPIPPKKLIIPVQE